MKHTCHANHCRNEIPSGMLMCRRHWAMVPSNIKTALLREQRPDQEPHKRPSEDYLRVAANAINAVAEMELKVAV